MIRYCDLTEEQKEVICNGCGPKGGFVPVPEFFCHASCDHHDFNYWLGCTEEDRRHADHQFLEAMLKDAGSNIAKQTIAFTYWMAVRLFGSTCFNYSDRERDESDLAIELEVYYDREYKRDKEKVDVLPSKRKNSCNCLPKHHCNSGDNETLRP